MIDQKRIINVVPEAPVFHPTVQEFKNVLEYIGSIKKAGEAAGIVKIVPPPGMCSLIFINCTCVLLTQHTSTLRSSL